jgi:hypothetical protein
MIPTLGPPKRTISEIKIKIKQNKNKNKIK